MKKRCYIAILSYCYIVLALGSNVVLAQTPADSSEDELTPTVIQVDNEKVKEIRDKVQKMVQERLAQIKQSGQRHAFVGKIIKIENLQITLETRSGERLISADEDTIIIDTKRKEIDLDGLEVDNQIICMGYTDQDNQADEGESVQMIAKRIVVVSQPAKTPLPRRAIFGKVIEIDENTLAVVVSGSPQEITYYAKATAKTKITKKTNGEIKEIKLAEIEVGDKVVIVGVWNEGEKTITAKFVHIITQL